MIRFFNKTADFLAKGLAVSAACLLFVSCLNDDDDPSWSDVIPNALVTVVPTGESYYMVLDDSTAVVPTVSSKAPYGITTPRRALANLRIESESSSRFIEGFKTTKDVRVNWLDTVLTKKPLLGSGTDADLDEYGKDPAELMNDWVTVCEDGYMTVHFQSLSMGGRVHRINLVKDSSKENPVFTFTHDASGDTGGRVFNGYVAFDLRGIVPEGYKGKITILWNSFTGRKSQDFECRMPKN